MTPAGVIWYIAAIAVLVVLWNLIGHSYGFDDPGAYERQGYYPCDAPSGWCSKEPETNPCGGPK
jgi:hypothetical protein